MNSTVNSTTDTGRSSAASSLPQDENENGLYVGSSAGSSFGMGQMLAIVNEINSTIPVTTVAFDNALKQASEYLTEMYQLLLTTMSQVSPRSQLLHVKMHSKVTNILSVGP